jgi:hypothetical protein
MSIWQVRKTIKTHIVRATKSTTKSTTESTTTEEQNTLEKHTQLTPQIAAMVRDSRLHLALS